MRILFAAAPGYGLFLPVVPLVWAARAAGHEVLLATSGDAVDVGARAGLPAVDVFPDRDLWSDLMGLVKGTEPAEDLSEEYVRAASAGNPFRLFALTMTEGTLQAGRAFGADLVVHTSDHPAGELAASALGVPTLEVGNRVSWSVRDGGFGIEHLIGDEIIRSLREKLALPDSGPRVLARIDPRPPSMGGLAEDQPKQDGPNEDGTAEHGAPWWPMRYVPFNGGAEVPEWARESPERPRICVTLGTVVPKMTGIGTLSAVLDALAAMDLEVVLAGGDADFSDLGELPANVRSVNFLPLSVFLPTCSLIVHHGGSGTTAAPLHYAVPQLVLPAFADNPMSAQRVVDRGVGLSHDPAELDAATVRDLVRRLLDEPRFARAAREVAAEMADQPSPAAVLDRVERALAD